MKLRRLLIVEDRPLDAELMVAELRRGGFEPTWERVDDEEAFVEALVRKPDLILCDYSLPGFSAPRAMAIMQEMGSTAPLVVVSGCIGDDAAIECTRAGAADYVFKDRPARLGHAVTGALERHALRAGATAAEHDLHVSEVQFHALLQSLDDVVFTLDTDQRHTQVFGHGLDRLKMSPGDFIGRTGREIFGGADSDVHERQAALALAGASLSYPWTAVIGQTERSFETSLSPIFGVEGEVTGVVGVGRETTKHTRVEEALRHSTEEIINRLLLAARFRDDETGEHIERMSRFCELIAHNLGKADDWCAHLRLASPMHDVGKIAVPDAILLKPGRLTPEERAIMQRHAEVGYRMLADSGIELLDFAASIALTHHERWDGSGYPHGLQGSEIPIEGRIAAVADTFDAVTSKRVYSSARPIEVALDIIRDGRGTEFDPDVVDAFLAATPDLAAVVMGAPDPVAAERVEPSAAESVALTTEEDAVATRIGLARTLGATIAADRFQALTRPMDALGDHAVLHRRLELGMQGDNDTVLAGAELVDLAVRLDVGLELDLAVVRRAIAMVNSEPGARIAFGVRLSSAAPVLAELAAARAANGLADNALVVQISEQEAVAHQQDAEAFFTRLQGMGCLTMLDGFGAGPASLHIAAALSFDYVCLDAGFIARAEIDPTVQLLVRAIAGVVSERGLSLVAADVGGAVMPTTLRALGVHAAEGPEDADRPAGRGHDDPVAEDDAG